MNPALLVLHGRSRESMPFDAAWKEHIAVLVHEALPVLALQIDPLPVLNLSIERRQNGALQLLQHMLRTRGSDALPSTMWQTFFVADGSVGESFLLIADPTSPSSPLRLRFGHSRHLPLLQAIAQGKQLLVQNEGYTLPLPLAASAIDLQQHLSWMRQAQQGKE